MKKNTFTFVELLVVISVILVLIGLSVPMYALVKRKALITKAHAQVSQLRIAIGAYEQSYPYLPFTPTLSSDALLSSAQYTVLIQTLGGDNPRGIKFLELETPGTYADPWGNSFKVALDLNYDTVICKLAGSPPSCSERLVPSQDLEFPSSIAIWSMGPSGADDVSNPGAESNKDNITSWQIQ